MEEDFLTELLSKIEVEIRNYTTGVNRFFLPNRREVKTSGVEWVKLDGFQKYPEMKKIFSGKGSTASVQGSIRLRVKIDDRGMKLVTYPFSARNIHIEYNDENDELIIKNFDFQLLQN